MKKTYVLFSILVMSLMTAGFSYAYWTDTLTVNGTAETGNIDVKWAPGTEYVSDSLYVDTSISIHNDKTLTLEFNNLYPGAVAYSTAYYYNAGSVPVKLNSVNMALTQPTETWDTDFTNAVHIYVVSVGSDYDQIASGWVTLTDVIENGWSYNFDNINSELLNNVNDRTLVFGEPLESHGLWITLYVVPYTLTTGMNIDNLLFDITLDFAQDT